MARLRNRRDVPNGGWKYIQKESHLKIEGESLDDLAKKVIAHRAFKGYSRATTDEAKQDIERQICTRMSGRECIAEGLDDEWVPVNAVPLPSLLTVMSASKAAFAFVAGGSQLVDDAERLRRTEICLTCPCNAFLTGCKCSSFYKLLNKTLPMEKRDMGLGVCSICQCSNQLKVNMPANVIKAGDRGRNLAYPAGCWVPAVKE